MLLLSFFFLLQLDAQPSQSTRPFTFQQLNLGFAAPEAFKLVDSSTRTHSLNPDVQVWRQHFIFQYNDASISASISTSTQTNIDWDNVYRKEAKQYYDQMRIRNPDIQYDSSFSTYIIGAHVFNKFVVTSTENCKLKTHTQYSRMHQGYKVNIGTTFTDADTGIVLEDFLKSFHFED